MHNNNAMNLFQSRAEQLTKAASRGDLKSIKSVMALNNPGENWRLVYSDALAMAALMGHIEVVRHLLPISDPKHNDSMALASAALEGHMAVVKALLPFSDPKHSNSRALSWAVKSGHFDIVRLLLPFSDPKADNPSPLMWAVRNGNIEMVKLLLPVSDAKAEKSKALEMAAEKENLKLVSILLETCNCRKDNAAILIKTLNRGAHEIARLFIPVSDLSYVLNSSLWLFDLNILIPHLEPQDIEKIVEAVQGREEIIGKMPHLQKYLLETLIDPAEIQARQARL